MDNNHQQNQDTKASITENSNVEHVKLSSMEDQIEKKNIKRLSLQQRVEGMLGLVSPDYPAFQVGDTVSVYLKLTDAASQKRKKERFQVHTGIVVRMRGATLADRTFTIRKIAAGNVAVKITLPLCSPIINRIELVRQGKVRRANLTYLTGYGRQAKVKPRQ